MQTPSATSAEPINAGALGGGVPEALPAHFPCLGDDAAYSRSNLQRVWLSRSEFEELLGLENALVSHNAVHGTAFTVLAGALVRFQEPSEARHFFRFVDSMAPGAPLRLVLRPLTQLVLAAEALCEEAPLATAVAWRDAGAAEADALRRLMEQRMQTATLGDLASAAWRLECAREWMQRHGGDVNGGNLWPLIERLTSFRDVTQIAHELEPRNKLVAPENEAADAGNNGPAAVAAAAAAVDADRSPDDLPDFLPIPTFSSSSDSERRPYSNSSGGGAPAEEEVPEQGSAQPESPSPPPSPAPAAPPAPMNQPLSWPKLPQAAVAAAGAAPPLPVQAEPLAWGEVPQPAGAAARMVPPPRSPRPSVAQLAEPLPWPKLPQAAVSAAPHAAKPRHPAPPPHPPPPIDEPLAWPELPAEAAAVARVTVKAPAPVRPPPAPKLAPATAQQPPRGKESSVRGHRRERLLSPPPRRRSPSPWRASRDRSGDRDRGRPRRRSDSSQEDLRYANQRRSRSRSRSRSLSRHRYGRRGSLSRSRSPPYHRRRGSSPSPPTRHGSPSPPSRGIGSSLAAAAAAMRADPNRPASVSAQNPGAAVWQMSTPVEGLDTRSPAYLSFFFEPTWRSEAALVAALHGHGVAGITIKDLHRETGGLRDPFPCDIEPFYGFIAARRFLFDVDDDTRGYRPDAVVYLRARAFPMLQWKRWLLEAVAEVSQRGGGRRTRAYRAPLADVLAAAPLPWDAPPSELDALRRNPERFINDRAWDSMVVTPRDFWASAKHRSRVTCLELRPFPSEDVRFPPQCRRGHPKACKDGPDCNFCHIKERRFHAAYARALR